MRPFHQILANNLLATVTNFTVWFGITFWVFLETGSVFATGMIAGLYLVLTAGLGVWLGSIVDHHRKKVAMLASSVASLTFFALALTLLQLTPDASFTDPYEPTLWGFALLVMLGVIAGNLRSIALPTLVTILVPESERDKANGLVGMVTGIGFLTTSVISGFLVANGGMRTVLALALVATLVAIAHLGFVHIAEDRVAAAGDAAVAGTSKIDLRGTASVVRAVPGLFALILFATFNNFLGGIFMALLDAYGLSLVSVETWGLLFGGLSTAFIVGGLVITKTGLGVNPVRTLLLINVVTWSVCCVFTLRSSIWLLAAGCFVWMLLGPIAEAAEHTTLQKVVPLERQGRVFGFAQSIEQAASPFTAFLIGPLAQFVVIPSMTDGAAARLIGGWFGTGPARGMALVFTVAGIVGLVVTLFALRSRAYRALSAAYARRPDHAAPAAGDDAAATAPASS
jgi:DHA3 family multidrug efflux protein-like MFS transporter